MGVGSASGKKDFRALYGKKVVNANNSIQMNDNDNYLDSSRSISSISYVQSDGSSFMVNSQSIKRPFSPDETSLCNIDSKRISDSIL